MRPILATIVLTQSLLSCARATAEPDDDAKANAVFQQKVRPLFAKYCFDCHGGMNAKAGVRLDRTDNVAVLRKAGKTWEKAAKMLLSGKMPPEDEPRPTAQELAKMTDFVAAELARFDCTGRTIFPGRVTIRRLNRIEYENTIRDLTGVHFDAESALPDDDIGNGFNNMADVLTLSPLHMEKYLAAAQEIAKLAIEQEAKRPPMEARILIERPSSVKSKANAARATLEKFAGRAFRRPIAKHELDRLTDLVGMASKQGETFEDSIGLAVATVLVSPQFLFRIEKDPSPVSPQAVRQLDDYELATRLSYFLWSTMPDERLFELARSGSLRRNLSSEVTRMLRDPKAKALVDNFASQWLQLSHLENVTPDPALFRQFDNALRSAMKTETEMFVFAIMREDRSILDLLNADYSFLNERLARHYGIDGVHGSEFRRVALPASQRGGVLTHASVLTITSNPNRTSPVKRGKWVLEQILGTPPPPPPDMVEQLDEEETAATAASLRDRLLAHRAKPECSVCHDRMDPIGFALENFDAVGAWRTHDGKFAINASGVLSDGVSFDDAAEFRSVLAAKKDQFCRALTEKMLTYALGRGLEYYDKCTLDKIVDHVSKSEYRFSSLILGVVSSDPFQMRGIEGTGE